MKKRWIWSSLKRCQFHMASVSSRYLRLSTKSRNDIHHLLRSRQKTIAFRRSSQVAVVSSQDLLVSVQQGSGPYLEAFCSDISLPCSTLLSWLQVIPSSHPTSIRRMQPRGYRRSSSSPLLLSNR